MFSHWRADAKERYLTFDCKNCRETGGYKRRVCFYKKRKQLLRFPLLEDGSKPSDFEVRNATREDVIEHLVAVHKQVPGKMIIDVLDFRPMMIGMNGEKVCPVTLFDHTSDWLVSLETAAAKYHTMPYPGSYLQQPLYIIEAFDICRGAEARWNNNKMLNIKKDK